MATNLQRRDMRGAVDLDRMAELVRRAPAASIHLVDLPYRLSTWALDAADQVSLWEDDAGELGAWAVLNSPFWTLDVACAHQEAGLMAAILGWADARARSLVVQSKGRPLWFALARATDAQWQAALEHAGFAAQDQVSVDPIWQVVLARNLTEPVEVPPLPEGYRLRPLAGEAEVAAYVALHQAAFASTSMTEGWKAQILRRPEYRPALDQVIVAPDGRLAAFCVCWLSPDGTMGQIEPMGVDPAHQRHGLGRIVLLAGLQRLQELGARRALVQTEGVRDGAVALYHAMGFAVQEKILMFRKDYPGE